MIKIIKKLKIFLIVIAVCFFLHSEYIYFETKRVIREYPEFYTFFKKEAEDITGEEFDLMTRTGVFKVRLSRVYAEVGDEIFQDRLDKLGLLDKYNEKNFDGEQVQIIDYHYFQNRLLELLLYNGIKSGLY